MADKTGAKLIVFGSAGTPEAKVGRIVNSAADTIATFDTGVDSTNAYITDDGNTIVYKKGASLQKSTTAAPLTVTPLVATGVETTFGKSDDNKRVLYSTMAPVGDEELVDLRGLDFTAAAPAPNDYVTTATVNAVGFNAATSSVLYLSDFTDKGVKVKSQVVAGGAEKTLGSDLGGVIIPPPGTGAGVVLITGGKQVSAGGQNIIVLDLGHVDSVAGGTIASIASDVPDGQVLFKGKTMVYVRFLQGAGSGLYSAALP